MSRKDFHGGRAYAAEAPPASNAGTGLGIGLTIAWLRLQLARLIQPRAS